MMFESATTLTIHPGRLDECLAILRESVVPILLEQPGLLSLAVVPLPEHNRISVLSIWQSLAHSQAAESNPRYRQAIQTLDPLVSETDSDASTWGWQPRITQLIYSSN